MSNTNKAILLSLALHVVLLSGLALLRPSFELGIGASTRYLEVALVAGPTAPDPSADATAADGAAAAESPAPARETATADETPPIEPAPPESTPAESRPADAPPVEFQAAEAQPAEAQPAEAQAAEAPPPETRLAESTPPDRAEPLAGPTAPPTDPPVPPDAPAPPAPVIAATVPDSSSTRAVPPAEAQVTESALAAAAVEPAAAVGLPALPPVREPIANVEADLLSERIEDWAESFAALGELRTTATWEDGDGVYEATVTHLPGGDASGYDEAVVTVTTTRDGRNLSTRVRLQRLGFSHYAQFIDRWDPEVRIHDDEIDGRFHANSDIPIARSAGVQPTFHGKVTTARSIDTSRSERRVNRSEVFLGGFETRVGRIPLPARLALFGDEAPDPSSVVELVGDTELRFARDGTYAFAPLLSRREERRVENGEAAADAFGSGGTGTLPADEPFYFIAAEDARIHVAGVVDGRVLVYTPADIVIEDDLVYAKHPTESVASDDFLGLVAEGNIEIADAGTTGPGDLEVHAALYARDRFAVQGFRSRRSGELIVIGSVTAGSLTATEPRFSTRLVFDRRLADTRPPAFPLTDRYEIAAWDGAWIVEP